jgi:hypothetical protein
VGVGGAGVGVGGAMKREARHARPTLSATTAAALLRGRPKWPSECLRQGRGAATADGTGAACGRAREPGLPGRTVEI